MCSLITRHKIWYLDCVISRIYLMPATHVIINRRFFVHVNERSLQIFILRRRLHRLITLFRNSSKLLLHAGTITSWYDFAATPISDSLLHWVISAPTYFNLTIRIHLSLSWSSRLYKLASRLRKKNYQFKKKCNICSNTIGVL